MAGIFSKLTGPEKVIQYKTEQTVEDDDSGDSEDIDLPERPSESDAVDGQATDVIKAGLD